MQLNSNIKSTFKFLTGRVMRNVYFWCYTIFQIINQKGHTYHYHSSVYYSAIAITTAILVSFSYINNLVLLPKYLLNKQKNVYIVLVVMFIIVFSGLHTLFLKTLTSHYPLIRLSQVSYITAPISHSWQVYAIIKDIFQVAVIYCFWAIVFTMAGFMTYYYRQEQVIEQAQQKQIETELSFLKSQINPHFLFNNLNNLYALAVKKSDKTPEIILKLSTLLRYLLYESNVESTSFEKEKEIMLAYIELELLRLPSTKNLNFSITADKPYKIPPLLWMPVLENVFKHGTRIISDNYYIDYHFCIQDGIVTIYSKNLFKNTVALSNNEKVGGIGLQNLRKRLELLFTNKYSLRSGIEDNFYIVEAKIEL